MENNFNKLVSYLHKNYDITKIKHKYTIIHAIYIMFVGIIMIFDTNVFNLLILLNIITLDGFAIIVFHKCPLVILEEKDLDTTENSSYEKLFGFRKNLGIGYDCEHSFENEINVVTHVWIIIALKCLVFTFLRMFNIKLLGNGIYS